MNDHKPLVSVVMSVFNGEKYLRAAMDSILEQTYRNFEFIIVDDGSTDASSTILAEYAQKDPRVRVIRQENAGLTKALNRAIQESNGEFVARQDADDISVANRLEILVKSIHGSDLLVSGWLTVVGERRIFPAAYRFSLLFPWSFVLRLQKVCNLFTHGTFFFRRSLFDSVGGYRPFFRYAQDFDFILRCMVAGKVSFVPAVLYELRLHRDSISSQKRQMQFLYALIAGLDRLANLIDLRSVNEKQAQTEESLLAIAVPTSIKAYLYTILFGGLQAYRGKSWQPVGWAFSLLRRGVRQ